MVLVSDGCIYYGRHAYSWRPFCFAAVLSFFSTYHPQRSLHATCLEVSQMWTVFYPASHHLQGKSWKLEGHTWRWGPGAEPLVGSQGAKPSWSWKPCSLWACPIACRGNHESWRDTHGDGVQRQSPWWGVRGQSPPEAESLVVCGHPMEAAKLPHSLYFANSLHIGLLCIFHVFHVVTFEVASMWNVQYCHSRQKVYGNSVRILSWFGSCTSPFWCSCKKCWAQIRTDNKPGFFFRDLRICQTHHLATGISRFGFGSATRKCR